MSQHTTIATIALLASLATLLFLVVPSLSDRHTMTTTPTAASDELQLSVHLSATTDRKLKITITNNDFTTPRTFLRWDTPFDPRALDMGILKLEDAESGQDLPSPGVKLNRRLPPPRDDLVEVPAGGEVSKEIELKAPWLPGDGRKVQVSAKGEWKAVWKKARDEVSNDELDIVGGQDVIRRMFRDGNSVEMVL